MKPVYKCDYCSKMGTEEEIREHEVNCMDNYDRKSCYTCVYKEIKCRDNISEKKTTLAYECKAVGREIPEGKIFEFCPQYKRKESSDKITDLFGNIFGFGL